MHKTDSTSWRWSTTGYETWLRTHHAESHLLFNPASGETHLLNDLAIQVLESLTRQPATLDELLQELDVTGAKESIRLAYHRLLGDLDRLGLITPLAA